MNTIVMLLVTSCAPGADPVTVIDAPPPVASYGSYSGYNGSNSFGNYGDAGMQGQAQESRPRFFSRLRNLFSRRSRGGDQPAPDYYASPRNAFPAYQGATAQGSLAMPGSMNAMNGTIISTEPMPTTTLTPTPSAAPIIRAEPTSSSHDAAPAQRMPAGSPF